MKHLFGLVILVLSLHNTNSMSTNDYCIRILNQCIGSYNSDKKYALTCQKTTCERKLSYECGPDFCAKNKRSCETISNLIIALKTYKGLLLFEKEQEKYSNFMRKIKKCSIKSYALQPDDICINGCHSMARYSFKFRMTENKPAKDMNCPCRGNKTFDCGKKFCAVHSNACDAFKKTETSFRINDCGNSDANHGK
jgi:hypothetical protein